MRPLGRGGPSAVSSAKHRLPKAELGDFPSPLLRLLMLIVAALGINYIAWRWLVSVNWHAWWIAVPLVAAETYSLTDSLLFQMTMWRVLRRSPPAPPPDGATADVFITTFNEPVDMVIDTAQAAQRITYPHSTWILDDGDRPELGAAASRLGIGYITRSTDWQDRPQHAKAGNLNNALFSTQGEYILVLDADQIPEPHILDRLLGYFRDPQMALVQSAQYFRNVPTSDPLGAQAPLFYGPIQQGKDGWNAAYFCGTNAVLRRDALMQIGIRGYVTAIEEGVRRTLYAADRLLKSARREPSANRPEVAAALDSVRAAVRDARQQLNDRGSLANITYEFQQRVDEAARIVVDVDVMTMRADLDAIAALGGASDGAQAAVLLFDDVKLEAIAERQWSPLGALQSIQAMVQAVNVDRGDEAQPMMPIATFSVTEDMATCMLLHDSGWNSAYHDEVLATGLAPDDAGTMLNQRLRWSQGTVQVLLRQNPLTQRGLTMAQRLMYFATMWGYLAGFASVVYIVAPTLYLIFGVMAVGTFGWELFARLVPFLILNQLLFFVISGNRRTWRGQQYSMALFPVWITACYTAALNVFFHRPLSFTVTPKNASSDGTAIPWRLMKWQLLAIGFLIAASGIGVVHLFTGGPVSAQGVGVSVFWVICNLAFLGVAVGALRYRGNQAVTH